MVLFNSLISQVTGKHGQKSPTVLQNNKGSEDLYWATNWLGVDK